MTEDERRQRNLEAVRRYRSDPEKRAIERKRDNLRKQAVWALARRHRSEFYDILASLERGVEP